LQGLQALAIANNAAMHILYKSFWGHVLLFFLGKIPSSGISGT
jgi:hypothetical protein